MCKLHVLYKDSLNPKIVFVCLLIFGPQWLSPSFTLWILHSLTPSSPVLLHRRVPWSSSKCINLCSCEWSKRSDSVHKPSPNLGMRPKSCIKLNCRLDYFFKWCITHVVSVKVYQLFQLTLYEVRKNFFEVPVDQWTCRFLLCAIFKVDC